MKRLQPGDYVCSPGLQFEYEILSYPLCRLYHEPGARFPFQPNKMEAGDKGYQKYYSYLVRLSREAEDYIIGEPFYITLREGYRYGRHEDFGGQDGDDTGERDGCVLPPSDVRRTERPLYLAFSRAESRTALLH